jgi:hypothetical protein
MAASLAGDKAAEPPPLSVYDAYVADEAELAARSPARRQGVGAPFLLFCGSRDEAAAAAPLCAALR